MRSNITKFPTQRNDLWSRARTKIQISLPPGQQENSNALPPGQSDRSKSHPMPCLPPPRTAGLTLIGALVKVIIEPLSFAGSVIFPPSWSEREENHVTSLSLLFLAPGGREDDRSGKEVVTELYLTIFLSWILVWALFRLYFKPSRGVLGITAITVPRVRSYERSLFKIN